MPADRPLRSTHPSLVVAFVGIPGAGKTTLGLRTAEELGAWVVSRDLIKNAMFVPCEHTAEEKRAAFEAVLAAVRANVLLRRSTVVDGLTFSRAGELEALSETVEAVGAELVAFFCDCPVEIAAARVADQLAGDGHVASDRTPDLVRDVARSFREIPPGLSRLDMTKPLAENISRVLEGCRAVGSKRTPSVE